MDAAVLQAVAYGIGNGAQIAVIGGFITGKDIANTKDSAYLLAAVGGNTAENICHQRSLAVRLA